MAAKAQISCDAGKCTGCKLCMLACSWVNNRTHQPHLAFIRVDVDEKNFACRIFLDMDRCTGCMSCVSFCPSGALQAVDPAVAKEGA